LVALPEQNPVALKNGNRCSSGPYPNNYFNFARSYPAGPKTRFLHTMITRDIRGVYDSLWWYTGDVTLLRRGYFSIDTFYPQDKTKLVDKNGYRIGLDPRIKKAGKHIFDIMNGTWPSGTAPYNQIDIIIDLHESKYNFANSICIGEHEAEGILNTYLPELNNRLEKKNLGKLSTIYAPVPTSIGWAGRYALPRSSVSFTVETDRTEKLDFRVKKQMEIILFLLEWFGMEPVKITSE